MIGKQAQSADGGSFALQAGGNITIGVSAAEARQIALDVFHANLLQFKNEAFETARKRGEQITEKIFSKLQAENPAGLNQAKTPDFQDAVFTAQKEFATAGDEDLGDLLVDLLVDRTKQEHRNLTQLVLSQALHTAPKLTTTQITTLSFLFVVQNVHFGTSGTPSQLCDKFARHLQMFLAGTNSGAATMGHLQFCGCGAAESSAIGRKDYWQWLIEQYPGLFKVGFSQERIEAAQLSAKGRYLLMPCINDASLFQVASINDSLLLINAEQLQLDDDDIAKLKTLHSESAMELNQVKDLLVGIAPFMLDVSKKWNEMPVFNLTSVGKAIGHANVKRLSGEVAPLSIWLDESSVAA